MTRVNNNDVGSKDNTLTMTWWLGLSFKVNENTNNSPRELPTVSVRDSAHNSTTVMTELSDDFGCCLSFSHKSLKLIVINGTNLLNVVSHRLRNVIVSSSRIRILNLRQSVIQVSSNQYFRVFRNGFFFFARGTFDNSSSTSPFLRKY